MSTPGEHTTVQARNLCRVGAAHQATNGGQSPPYALRDEAAYGGKTIGTAYGEPFTCREPIGLSSLRELV